MNDLNPNDRNHALGSALEKLATENAAIGTPPDVELNVLAAFDARQKPRRRRFGIPAFIAATALGTLIVNHRNQALRSALEKLATENAAIGTPPDVELNVLAAFDARQKPRRRRFGIPAFIAATALGTLIVNHRNQALRSALEKLATENAAIGTPPDVELNVLAAFDARQKPRRRRFGIPAFIAATALGTLIVNHRNQALRSALEKLATENAAIGTPPDVELNVMAAFDARQKPKRRRFGIPAFIAATALGTLIVNHRNQALRSALEKLATENAAIGTPPDVELNVMAAFDARQKPKRRRFGIPAFIAATALGTSIAIATFWFHRPAPVPLTAEAPFIGIPYVAPPAPYERTEVKRMDVPLAALIAAGLDVHGTDTGGSVRADVLIGQDGRALAIRLVRKEI